MDRSGGLPRRGRAAVLASRLLLAAGIALILAAGATQLYAMYAQMRWERAQDALSVQFLLPAETPRSELTLQPATIPTPIAPAPPSVPLTATPVAQVPAQPSATPTPEVGTDAPRVLPLPTPTPTPDDRSDPGRLLIPKLKVDTQIVLVPLVNRQWDVSHIIYEAGLLNGTGWPGRPGNAVLAGHVSLKGLGDGPFRWLEKLMPGDRVIVEQSETRYTFHVTQARVVLPSDGSVLVQTENATLTVITCSDWDLLRAEYSRRLVVTAVLVDQRRIGLQ